MKKVLFWIWIGLVPQAASAQALLAGSEYYDSFDTIAQVVILKAAHNEEGRDYLAREGHILPKASASLPIIVIAHGQEPESGCEFRFPDYPRTYWTFSENVATIEELKGTESSPSPSPSALPAARPTATPETAVAKASPSKKQKAERGAIEWHQVDGKWKWRPLDAHQFKGWQAGTRAPAGEAAP